MKTIVYVKGTVRKDAVEIIPKEVRVPEAMVLEGLYGEAWVPTSVREVQIEDDQYPDAQSEIDRLQGHYGADIVNQVFGTAVQARKDVGDLLKMDGAKAVKESGVIPEVAGPISVEAAPEKGTKAYAQKAVEGAEKDQLKPTIQRPEENPHALQSPNSPNQQGQEDEEPEEDDEDLSNLTKAELQAKLDEKGIAYPASATKAELIELLHTGE